MAKVAVIGAGIIGLLTAYELTRRGHSVEVRSSGVAEGATYAAAGMLAPGAEMQYGQGPLWQLMQEAGELHRRLAADLPSRTRLPAGYREDSTLVVGRDHADVTALTDLAVTQRAAGIDVEELSSSQARRRESALARTVAGGVHLRRDHQVDPRLLAAALHDALPAPVVTGRVDSLEDIDAERIVLAAGLAVPGIDGPHQDLDLQLRPVRGDILRLGVPPSLLLPGQSSLLAGTVRALVRGRPVYLVPRDDGQLVLGATSREDDLPGPSSGGVLQLLQDAAELVPAVRETELLEVTARDRPGTPDDLPLLGPVPGAERVIVSTGYHRHGILLSAWAAARTADLIDGEDRLPATVRPERFTPSLQEIA